MRTISDKELVAEVRNLMTNHKLYKDPELSLNSLADRMNVPRNRLSRAINDVTGKNFSTYVNGFRLKEAVRVLSEPRISPRFVLGFYKEAGFTSKSTFYKTFKEVIGVSPAEFKKAKKAEKEKKRLEKSKA
ncbi:AraC family transcriptional regulator [Bacteroides sp. 224]|uniref:helix-turn-helix domain-containing protein n=1 Tax=Bacteroides sp. 224 TaxID=2302936 RepID=UPI0013D5D99E|nr:AraC family transcriptional regulator [Bacteroides sp. 224]NDV65028.1 AraC family transcriptional regulator [Bacteroides sp. 224]